MFLRQQLAAACALFPPEWKVQKQQVRLKGFALAQLPAVALSQFHFQQSLPQCEIVYCNSQSDTCS